MGLDSKKKVIKAVVISKKILQVYTENGQKRKTCNLLVCCKK